MKVKAIGIDLPKDVFGVHGVDARGKALVHKRVTRRQLVAAQNFLRSKKPMDFLALSGFE
jgi:hypothetical protein